LLVIASLILGGRHLGHGVDDFGVEIGLLFGGSHGRFGFELRELMSIGHTIVEAVSKRERSGEENCDKYRKGPHGHLRGLRGG